MSETPQGQAPGTGAPTTTTPAPAPPRAAPPPVIPPTPSKGAAVSFTTQEAFNERMTRGQASYAKGLGLTGDPVQDKPRLEALFAIEQAQKSEAERTTEALAAAEAAKADHQRYAAAVAKHAALELGKLSEAQRAAVQAAAGDDPARQLETITAFAPTWAQPPATASAEAKAVDPNAAAAAAKQAAPQAPPASSIARPNSPPPAGGQPTSSRLAAYQHLQRVNPMRAAGYLTNHFAAIQAEKKAAGSPS